MKAQPATELRRRGAAFCLFAAPLLMFAGDALRYGAGMQRTWLVMFKLSFAFFVGAALALVHLVSGRADRAGLLGGVLAVVGSLSGSGIVTANAVIGTVESAGLDQAATLAVESAMRTSEMGAYILLYPLPGLAFPAGFLVLSYALLRARAASPAAAGALALGALLFPVGRIGGIEAAILGSGLAMSLGMGMIALRLLASGAGVWERPPRADEMPAGMEGRTSAA